MDFELSPVAKGYQERLLEFMDEWVYPNEAAAEEQIAASGDPHHHPEILETLKAEARRRGSGTFSCRTRRSGRPGCRISTTPLWLR